MDKQHFGFGSSEEWRIQGAVSLIPGNAVPDGKLCTLGETGLKPQISKARIFSVRIRLRLKVQAKSLYIEVNDASTATKAFFSFAYIICTKN